MCWLLRWRMQLSVGEDIKTKEVILAGCKDASMDAQVAEDIFALADDLFDPLAVDWREFFTLACGSLLNKTSIRGTACHIVSLLGNETEDGMPFELFSQLFKFSMALDPEIDVNDVKAYLDNVKNSASVRCTRVYICQCCTSVRAAPRPTTASFPPVAPYKPCSIALALRHSALPFWLYCHCLVWCQNPTSPTRGWPYCDYTARPPCVVAAAAAVVIWSLSVLLTLYPTIRYNLYTTTLPGEQGLLRVQTIPNYHRLGRTPNTTPNPTAQDPLSHHPLFHLPHRVPTFLHGVMKRQSSVPMHASGGSPTSVRASIVVYAVACARMVLCTSRRLLPSVSHPRL